MKQRLTNEIKSRGDRRIGNPGAIADEFLSKIALKAAAAGTGEGYAPAVQIRLNERTELEDIDPVGGVWRDDGSASAPQTPADRGRRDEAPLHEVKARARRERLPVHVTGLEGFGDAATRGTASMRNALQRLDGSMTTATST